MTSNTQNRSTHSPEIATIFVDRDLKITAFSQRARETFGWRDLDIGASITDVPGFPNYPDLKADLEAVISSRLLAELEVQAADGKTYLVRSTPYSTSSDRVDGAVIAIFDITERVSADAQLKVSNTEVGEILESMSDALLAVDRDWRLTSVNRRAERFLGRRRDELLGKSIWNVFPADDEPELYAKLHKAGADAGQRSFKALSSRLSRWVEVSVFPAASGAYIYLRDITTRQKREDNLAFLAEINSDLAGD